MIRQTARRRGRRESRAVLMEFVMCIPIVLTLFFFIVQLAQIMISQQVVAYAAYAGARATMTCNIVQRKTMAEYAVKRVLAAISGSPSSDKGKDEYSVIDGWGRLPFTAYLDKQVEVDVLPLPYGSKCNVRFKMFLLVPVAGRLISYFANDGKLPAQDPDSTNPMLEVTEANEIEIDGQKFPFIELKGSAIVHIPYSTLKYPLAEVPK
ncbi:MAG: pilus assembly protein [Victivallaceae bacterium]|nr:pilus assembly protein [Victivallaceae bacterium]